VRRAGCVHADRATNPGRIQRAVCRPVESPDARRGPGRDDERDLSRGNGKVWAAIVTGGKNGDGSKAMSKRPKSFVRRWPIPTPEIKAGGGTPAKARSEAKSSNTGGDYHTK